MSSLKIGARDIVPDLSRPTFQPPTVSFNSATVASWIAWPWSIVFGCSSAGNGARLTPVRFASARSFAAAVISSVFISASRTGGLFLSARWLPS
jgi:hypothetical protein